MKWTLILACSIALPLLAIYAVVASKLAFLLFPVVEKNILYQYSIQELGTTPMLGVLA